jgi:hypothetical protein
MSFRTRLVVVGVAAACLFGAPAIHAQAITGTIQGAVADQEGDAVPGVTVTATNTATGYQQIVTSNDSGRFSAPLLPLGPYSLTFALDGFATLVRDGLQVSLGQRIFLEVTLQLSTVGEEITVTDEAPLIESTRTEGQTRIDDRSIRGLPNDGRNFLKFSELTPGVTIVQGPDGDELSISGQRGINNNVSVDGADFNNPFFGEQRGGQRPGFTFNQDAIKEMVVIADGAPAEFGRSSGGFVNVITKSGTNSYNGTAHVFNKSDSLSQCPKTREGRIPNCDFDRTQVGFTFGGPIKKDKAFIFLAADAQEADETKQTDPNRMPADLVSFLDSVGIPGDNGPISRTDDADAYLAKFDWLANDSNLVTLRAAYTYSQQVNGTFDVDSWGRSMNGIETDYSRAFTTSVISNVSNNLLNEFRGQYAKEFRPRPYDGPTNPETGRPFPDTRIGDFGFGMPFFLPIEYDDDRLQLNNNISILKGNHSIKAGVEYNEVGSSQTFIGFASGRYVFFSLDAFLAGSRSATDAGLYLQLVPVQGNTVNSVGTQTITQKEPAIFIQDQWQPTANLTLEFGVRWEQQDQPGPRTPPNEVFFADFIGQTVTNEFGTFEFPSDGTIPDDDSIQPRVALAWSPDAKSVVRASAGLYMARLPALMLASSRSTNGSIGGNVRPDQVPGLPPPVWPDIVPPEFTSGLDALFRPEIFLFDKDFELPKTTSLSLSYEREIRPNWALLLKGNYAETDHLFRMFNQNTPYFGCPWSTGLGATGNNGVACAGSDGAEALHTVESTARSEYTAVTVGLNKRYSNNYQFQIYYTNSEDMSDDDNERDPFNYRYARADSLDKEWSYSDRHSRHRVNAWLSWQAPKGIDVNVRYSYRSAQPLSVNAAGEPIGFLADRIEANQPFSGYCFFTYSPECFDAPVTQRNLGKKDNKLNVWDLRVSKDFEMGKYTIQPAIDIFNVFDEANFLRPEVGGLDFNFDGTLRTGAGDPQEIQLGVRVFW